MGRSLIIPNADFSAVSIRVNLKYSIIEDRSSLNFVQNGSCSTAEDTYAFADKSTPKSKIYAIKLHIINKGGGIDSNSTYTIGAWKTNGTLRIIGTYKWTKTELDNGEKLINLSSPINGDEEEYLYIAPNDHSTTTLLMALKGEEGGGFIFLQSDNKTYKTQDFKPGISYYSRQ